MNPHLFKETSAWKLKNSYSKTHPGRFQVGHGRVFQEVLQTRSCYVADVKFSRIVGRSYPVRTTISGFDPSFNAVTGLNGSGKSNILDAICFVLGITNLSAILMGGATKYLINGHRSTQNSVQNLFQSVQLNINNPNFLIMQGKITKVLNMKPQEILGMIEEAAGTSMFEERKERAVKTMAKKDKKMEEIQELLREEIEPKLNRLREEKRTYLAYQQNEAQLEILARLCLAWDHFQANRKLQDILAQIESKNQEIHQVETDQDRLNKEIRTIDEESVRINRKMEQESKKGGKVEKLEKTLTGLSTDVARLNTQVELSQKTWAEEQTKVKELAKAEKELTAVLEAKKAQATDLNSQYAQLKAEFDNSTLELKKAEELLQTLVTGLTNDDSEGANAGGYMGQLAHAKQQVADLASEAEQARVKMGHLNKELKEKEPKAKKLEKEGGGAAFELQKAQAEKKQLEQTLEKIDWDENAEVTLRQRRDAESDTVSKLLADVNHIKSRLSQLDFTYADPVRNFDHTKVKGLVAQLITVDPSSLNQVTALEVCAGGRLYNVVVEDNVTASQLLDNGRLTRKVTMIPLNQIRAFVASAGQLSSASKISNNSAKLALELIGYDADVSKAMEFVFGNTLICPDAQTAKHVTFDPNVRMKSVTFDGDIYDPSGTLSGGSKPSTSGILIKVQELKKVEKLLRQHQSNLQQIEEEWQASKSMIAKFNQTKKDLDLKSHEVTLLEERVKESNTTRIISEVATIRNTLEELNALIANSKQKQNAAEAESQADISQKKANMSKTSSTVKAMQREVQGVEMEIEQLASDVSTAKKEVEEATEAVEAAKLEHEALKAKLKEVKEAHAQADVEYKQETKRLDVFRRELADMEKAKQAKLEVIGQVDSTISTLRHKIDSFARERKSAHDAIERIENTYEWVAGAKNVEKREKELTAKHTTVIKDKGKIEETIARLYEYKLEALTKAWTTVNGEFGQIFDTLLPGNWCELQPAEGKTLSQGLEVRVRLGSTWKSSLTELSGGQRSLIALSLIMSLLKTHPSPIYILDEVDAALDLQHTQNLGLLFKHRFKGSQFIVVSLKEGLFTNANVLFRTRFRDGTSVVERTVSRSTSGLYNNEDRGSSSNRTTTNR
ncbi:hypothetical protein PSHT_15817 [Puccinia striiformis]|uniref:SMC hinge domain-containing protein n=1 Tax=Puccinia striiformis TaxID=27350 RepID=A0A2S4UD22_9BASI|nr:hypothetical protein PSHT_15817 [Puccinia striiformis]